MAERRCFSQAIVESDAFLGLPLAAQGVYFHLCMGANNYGFVTNPYKIATICGGSSGEIQLLAEKRFILMSQTGVAVIKHWRISNRLRTDRNPIPVKRFGFGEQLYLRQDGAYTDHTQPGAVLIGENDKGLHNTGRQLPSVAGNGWQLPSEYEYETELELESEQEQEYEVSKQVNQTKPESAPIGEGEDGLGLDWCVKFFEGYPQQARGNWGTLIAAWQRTRPEGRTVMENLERWKGSALWQTEGGRYIPYAANFIAKGYWRTPPSPSREAETAPEQPYRRQLDQEEKDAIARMLKEGQQT